jgi:WD40 repeat protein
VACSPDGQTLLTGCADGHVYLWDLARGSYRKIHALTTPMAAAFSPDGKRFLTAGWDNCVRFWDAATSEPVGRPLPHKAPILSTVLSPDGTRVATGCEDADTAVYVWNLVRGEVLWTLTGHLRKVPALAFSPDSNLLLTGSWDRTARLWDLRTGRPHGEPLCHQDLVQGVAFSPDGMRALTGGDDYTTRLWETATGKPIGLPLRHASKIQAVAFSPDGRLILTGTRDNTARLCEAATGQPLGTPLPHRKEVRAVGFTLDGRHIVTASMDGTACLWQAPAPRPDVLADLTSWLEVYTGLTLGAHGATLSIDAVRFLEALTCVDPGTVGQADN